MKHEIVTRKFEDTPVMYVPMTITWPQLGEITAVFDSLAKYVMQNGGEITGSFLLYGKVTGDVLNFDCCMAVSSLLPESGDIKAKVVPGGGIKVAHVLYKGPYSGLSTAWSDLMGWLNTQKDYVIADEPMREIYLNESMDAPESEYVTELVVPVRGA